MHSNETKVLGWGGTYLESIGQLKLWDIKSEKPLFSITQKGFIKKAIFSNDEKYILSWGENKIQLWSSINGESIWSSYHNEIDSAIFTKDNKYILSWSNDEIKLWNTFNGKCLFILNTFTNVIGVKFSKDEKKIISWSSNGKVKTYKLYRDRKLKKEFYPLEAEVETGVTLTKSGEIRVLSKEEWEEKKRKYEIALRESE